MRWLFSLTLGLSVSLTGCSWRQDRGPSATFPGQPAPGTQGGVGSRSPQERAVSPAPPTTSPSPRPIPSPAPVAPATAATAVTEAPATPAPPLVRPANPKVGRITSVNPNARFVVLTYAIGNLPPLERRLNVYREGLKVAELRITGPSQDINTVADITAGECQIGDEVRED